MMESSSTLEVTPAGRAQSIRALRLAKLAGVAVTRAMYQAAKGGIEVDNWDVRTYQHEGDRGVAIATGFDETGNIVCSLTEEMYLS